MPFKKSLLSLVLATAAVVPVVPAMAAPSTPIRNVVLVHGAFADGSGWKGVYDLLVKEGYKVSIVQEPETSLADDVAAVKRVLDLQDGPVVLVGHSWGGQVITEAGMDPKVKSLVYVAALMPEVGESVNKLEGSMPAVNDDVKKTADGAYYYMDPAKFVQNFAADAPADVAKFMAVSQVMVSVSALDAPVGAAAWKSKPSWAIVAGADKTINPELERWMYKRAGAKVTEVPGSSHAVFLKHAKVVASVIRQAAAVQP